MRREKAKVVAARVEPPLKESASKRLEGDREPRIIWRRRQQHRPGARHPAHLAQQLRYVNDVLECLAAPDKIEPVVGKRQRRALLALDELCLRRDLLRTSQGFGGGVNANDTCPSADQRGAEAPIAAAEVKHTLAFNYVGQ